MGNWLFYTKRERRGACVLLGILLVIGIIQWLPYSPWAYLLAKATLTQEGNNNASKPSTTDTVTSKVIVLSPLKNFDPNTVDSIGLLTMQVPQVLINNWLNYRKAGGVFKQKEDLLKLYYIDSSLYQQLHPYMDIKSTKSNKRKAPETPLHAPPLNPQPFNPNTVDSAVLLAMGLRTSVVKVWMSYRRAGGRFRQAKDLYKLYGIKPNEVEALSPFVQITNTKDTLASDNEKEYTSLPLVEINTADSGELLRVKGIGKVFAKRIISYRTQLGGYHKAEQLLEIYGMTRDYYELIHPQIKIDSSFIQLISINHTSKKDLANHPYISYTQARQIYNYRYERGHWKRDKLIQSGIFTPTEFLRLRPYISFTD